MSLVHKFAKVYSNDHYQRRQPGVLKIAAAGMAWRCNEPEADGSRRIIEVFTEQIRSITWSHSFLGSELIVTLKGNSTDDIQYRRWVGFEDSDYEKIYSMYSELIDSGVEIESRECASKGHHWGDVNVTDVFITFTTDGKVGFEIPITALSQTQVTGHQKDQLTLEFKETLSTGSYEYLSEVRFQFMKPQLFEDDEEESLEVTKMDDQENESVTDEKSSNDNSGNGSERVIKTGSQSEKRLLMTRPQELAKHIERYFANPILNTTSIVVFQQLSFQTPRGKFSMEIYKDFIRLYGKLHDFILSFEKIQRLFVLPAVDMNTMHMVLQVNPPIKKGSTLYPFFVFSFDNNATTQVSLGLNEEEIEEVNKKSSKVRIEQKMSGMITEILPVILRALTGARLVVPSSDFQAPVTALPCISCVLKYDRGNMYIMDNHLFYLYRPETVYLKFSDISFIDSNRVGSNVEITVHIGDKNYHFTSINKKDFDSLKVFLKKKNVRLRRELVDDNEQFSFEISDSMEDHDDYLERIKGGSDGNNGDGHSGLSKRKRRTSNGSLDSSPSNYDNDGDDEEDEDYKESSEEEDFSDDDSSSEEDDIVEEVDNDKKRFKN